MKNGNAPNLNAVGLLILATVLGVFCPAMVGFIYGSDPVKASDWIGFAGSVLTAGVACVAIYFAWRGIVQQSRLDLLSREEDRIERELPGLQDAVLLTSTLHRSLKAVPSTEEFPALIFHIFELEGIRSVASDAHTEVEKRLPMTDIRTRREIRGATGVIIIRTEIARRAIEQGSKPEEEMNGVAMAIGMFIGLEEKYKQRIKKMEARSATIRAEIELAIK